MVPDIINKQLVAIKIMEEERLWQRFIIKRIVI